MGTRSNRLIEAVQTCTHNRYFEIEIRKISNWIIKFLSVHLNRRFYVMTARPELEVLTVGELSQSPTETYMYSSF